MADQQVDETAFWAVCSLTLSSTGNCYRLQADQKAVAVLGKKEKRRIKAKDSAHRKLPRHPSYLQKPKSIYRWYERLRKKNLRKALQRREELLSSLTKSEHAFEKILQEIAIDYEREHIIMLRDYSVRFIDFYSNSAKIGFEVDGGYHKDRVEEDIDRDIGIMAAENILMVRFINEDVLGDPEGTKEKILQTLWARVEWWKQHHSQVHRMDDWVSKQ